MSQRLFEDSFEDNYTRWSSTSFGGDGAIARSQIAKHHGKWSSRQTVGDAGANSRCTRLVTASAWYFFRMYARFETVLPTNAFWGVGPRFSKEPGTATFCYVIVDPGNQKFGVRNTFGVTNVYETNTTLIIPDVWYCLELYMLRHATAGAFRLWVDGELKVAQTGVGTGANPNSIDGVSANWYNGSGAPEVDRGVYLDDAVLSLTYIGPERDPFKHCARRMGQRNGRQTEHFYAHKHPPKRN